MGNIIGLVFYVIVAIVVALIKKSAEEKTKDTPVAPIEERPDEVVKFEEVEEAIEGSIQLFPEEPTTHMVSGDREFAEYETPKSQVRVQPEMQEERHSIRTRRDLAKAVVMSEIIRMPRAKRPWPIR